MTSPIQHSFHSELPSGQSILVEAEITPPVEGRMYGEPGDCYPDEHGSAEIQSVMMDVEFTCRDGHWHNVLHVIDTDDIWVRTVRRNGDVKFCLFNEELAESAYDDWIVEESP